MRLTQGQLFKPKPFFNEEEASQLSELIRFGTSTWTYPGWKGQIYHNSYQNEKDFKQNSLAEYSQQPWFKTVGIDSFFYKPPRREQLTHYAKLLEPDFQWVTKVWERITIPKYPTHPRYGEQRGKDNPDFLNSKLFIEQVLRPFADPTITKHTGPFIFQFPHIANSVLNKEDFLQRLSNFTRQLPTDFQYAVEIRNPDYLEQVYFEILNDSKITHCFNHWSYMPSLKEQMIKAANFGGLSVPFYLARILTPLGLAYQDAVEKFKPYNQIKEVLPDMRRDVVTFATRAINKKKPAFIIVNNRSEGNAPRTIEAIGQMLINS